MEVGKGIRRQHLPSSNHPRSPPTTPFLVPSLPLANPRRIVRTKTHRSHHSTKQPPPPARTSLHLSSTVIVEPVLLRDAVPPTTWIHHFPSAHFPPPRISHNHIHLTPARVPSSPTSSPRLESQPVVYNRHRRSWVPRRWSSGRDRLEREGRKGL